MEKFQVSESAFLKMLTEADSQVLFNLVDGNRVHLREWLPWLDNSGRFGKIHQSTLRKEKVSDLLIFYLGKFLCFFSKINLTPLILFVTLFAIDKLCDDAKLLQGGEYEYLWLTRVSAFLGCLVLLPILRT